MAENGVSVLEREEEISILNERPVLTEVNERNDTEQCPGAKTDESLGCLDQDRPDVLIVKEREELSPARLPAPLVWLYRRGQSLFGRSHVS